MKKALVALLLLVGSVHVVSGSSEADSPKTKVVRYSTTVEAGADVPLQVACPQGQRSTGGGYDITPTDLKDDLFVRESAPALNGRGWGITVTNRSTNFASATVIAVCLRQ